MPKYDWILFDADNTLFDFDTSSKVAFYQAMDHHQLAYPNDIYSEYKKINAGVWKELEEGKITQEELRSRRFKLFFDQFGIELAPRPFNQLYLDKLIENAMLLEQTLSLLNLFKDKVKNVIITNGLKEVQRPRIQKVNIEHYFETIIVSDEIGVAKPDRAFFDYTFQKINYPPKEKVLVVGDSLNSDIKGGNNYGVNTCWYNPKKLNNLTSNQPTYEITELKALQEIILG